MRVDIKKAIQNEYFCSGTLVNTAERDLEAQQKASKRGSKVSGFSEYWHRHHCRNSDTGDFSEFRELDSEEVSKSPIVTWGSESPIVSGGP